MRKNFARSVLFALTILLTSAFTNQLSAQTVDNLVFGGTKTNIFDISAPQVSTTVVINEIYGGGGNANASFNQDYIELFNKTGADINLATAGYSLQYGSAAGTTFTTCAITTTNSTGGNAVIPANGYFLVAFGPVSPTVGSPLTGINATCPTTINLSATAGKVALTSTSATASTSATTGTGCPPSGSAPLIDFVGYGTGTNCSETSVAPVPTSSGTPAGTNVFTIQRIPNGGDTDNNTADFRIATGTPKAVNTGASNTAPTISDITDRTTPANTATGNITFTIGDAETSQTFLTVTATSSNQTLVPNANITLGGTGASRTINITPAANQSGTTTITVTVSDGITTTSDTFVLTVTAANSAPVITSANNTTFTQGTFGSFQVTASGSPAPTFSTTGPLPNGVTLSSSGLLSGTPTQSGTFTFDIVATNSAGTTSQTFTLTVNAPANTAPTITATPVSVDKGTTATGVQIATVSDDGGAGNVTVTVSPTSNQGISISNIVNTNGVITANVTASCGASSASFTLTATDTGGLTAQATLNVTATDSTVATRLVFTQSPTDAASGATLSTTTVSAANACGTAVTNFNGSVTVAISQGAGTLGGTTTQTAVNGVATFNDLSITTGTTDSFRLSASASGLTSGNSAQFTVTAAGDTTPPTVTSITRTSANPAQSGSTVSYSVVFSEAVSGVDAADFTFTTTGGTTAAVTGIAQNSASNYTVFVQVGTGPGTVRLDVTDNDSIVDTAGNPLGGSGVGNGNFTSGEVYTVNAPPPSGTVQFSSATYTVGEAGGSVTLTVTRAGGSSGAVTVNYTLGGGSATGGGTCGAGGVDYNNAGGTITFADGDAADKQFTVGVCSDAVFEGSETFNATLSIASGGATLGTPNPATVTITDGQSQPTLSIGNVSQSEGNSGTTAFNFPVTLSNATTQTVTVNYTTSDGTATVADNDYAPVTNGTVTIPAGQTSGTATVLVNGDSKNEGNETFTVALSNPVNATILNSPGTGTIQNDDVAAPAGTASFSSATYTGGETAGTVVLTVQRSGGSAGAISATVSFTNGTATGGAACGAGVDYVSTPATVNFADGDTANKTVSVTLCADAITEGNETFTATLSGAASGQTTATVTITDDSTGDTVTLGSPSCEGISPAPFRPTASGNALLCFSLSANNGARFTGLTVPFSSDPSVKYANPKLIKSTDNNYRTQGDNMLVANGTVDNMKFTFTGFSALTENALEKALSPNLAPTPTIFFVVADVLPTANSGESTPTISAANIMTTPQSTVTGNSVSSPTAITFAPAGPTAGMVGVGGRVVASTGRGIFRARVRMTDASGIVRTAYTNSLGYYRFNEVEVGQTLIFDLKMRGYKFTEPTRVVSLTEEINTINFTAY